MSDPASGERMYEEFQTWDAYLLGRRTYDIFASFWPNQPDDPFTRLINDLPRYVASRTLTEGRLGGHDHPRRRRRRSRSPTSRSATSGSGSGAAPTSSRRCCATTSSTASISGSTLSCWARASASSRRAPFPQRSAGRRSRPSTAARSTPSTSTPARRRTRRWATGARPARACSCAADGMRRPRGEDAAGVVCASTRVRRGRCLAGCRARQARTSGSSRAYFDAVASPRG